MVIVIIGSSGFIGQRIFQSLTSKNAFNLIGTYYKHKEKPEFIYLDVTSKELIEQFLVEYRPDLILWIAGSKNLNKCEDDWEYAYQINTQPIKDYYEIKRRLNLESRLVYFSTDYVFDGNNFLPYQELDKVAPIGVYGNTKRSGELEVINSDIDAIVIRTSWLYSAYGNNFVKTMLRLGNEKDELGVIFDQVGTPTNASDLAKEYGESHAAEVQDWWMKLRKVY